MRYAALRSPLMVDGACKISSINQSINEVCHSFFKIDVATESDLMPDPT